MKNISTSKLVHILVHNLSKCETYADFQREVKWWIEMELAKEENAKLCKERIISIVKKHTQRCV